MCDDRRGTPVERGHTHIWEPLRPGLNLRPITLLPWHKDAMIPPKTTASSILFCLCTNTHTNTHTKRLTGLSPRNSGLLLQGVYYSISSHVLCALSSLHNARWLFWNPVLHSALALSLFGYAFKCRGAPHIMEACEASNFCLLSVCLSFFSWLCAAGCIPEAASSSHSSTFITCIYLFFLKIFYSRLHLC